jgi:hypothetical protein
MDNINVSGQMSQVNNTDMLFSVYPNPNKGTFTIRHELSNPVVSVLSMDGRVVWSDMLKSSKETIQLKVSPGVYLVRVYDGLNTRLKKMTIE